MQTGLKRWIYKPVYYGILWSVLSVAPVATAEDVPVPPAMLQPPMAMEAASQQVPMGMKLKVAFLTGLDTASNQLGDAFVVETTEDFWTGEQLILPKGTVVRGRVQALERPGFFSKGGLMRLAFDHIQLPTGDLQPLSLQVDAATAKMSAERGAFYTDPGVGAKLNASVDKGISQYKTMHEKGVKAGKELGGGINMLLTVPATAIAGVASGTAVTTVNAAKAVFGRGESVSLKPGEVLLIDFSKSAILPAH